jgi:TRAP-type C4-dicarboxylate transport system permease small subunit
MKKIFSILDWVINKSIYIAGAAVIFIMVYTTLNVIMRVLGHPLSGDIEVTQAVLVVIIYFVIAACLLNDKHIKIELFKKWSWLDHVNNVIAFGISLLIAIQAFHQVGTAARMHVSSTLLGIPRAPFIFVSGLGFLLFAIAVLSVEYRLITSRRKTRTEQKPEDQVDKRREMKA